MFDSFQNDIRTLQMIAPRVFHPLDAAAQIQLTEAEHRILFPQVLRFYYEETGDQRALFPKSAVVRILNAANLTAGLDLKHGPYLVFAESASYKYAYFERSKQVMSITHTGRIWNPLPFPSLAEFLLYYLAKGIMAQLCNSILAPPIKAPRNTDRIQYTEQTLGCRRALCAENPYYFILFSQEHSFIGEYDYDRQKKYLFASDNHDVIQAIVQQANSVWITEHGCKRQNPAKYLGGEPPNTFFERIRMIHQILFPNRMPSTANSLDIKLPICVSEFYALFGDNASFLNADMHIINTSELTVSNNRTVFAYENQSVCSYAFSADAGFIFQLQKNREYLLEVTLTQFLEYLACVQGCALLPCCCTAENADISRLEPYFYRLNDTSEFSCYLNPKRKIIMIRERNSDTVTLASKSDSAMCTLETDSGVPLNWN